MKKNYWLSIITLVLLAVAFIIFAIFYNPKTPINAGKCQTDSDCIVYGVTGDCCGGCYNSSYQKKWNYLQTRRKVLESIGIHEGCFCAVSKSCKCENNKCLEKFK